VVTKGTTPTTIGARFQNDGVKFIKVESLDGSRNINHAKIAYIDEATHALLKRSRLDAGDLLFSIAGTIGRVAVVGTDDLPGNTNQALAIIRPDECKIDTGFLYYCLRDETRVARARTRVVQSVQQNLSLAEVSNIDIPILPRGQQVAIARTLGALDDKIESNRRIVKVIPSLIRAYVEVERARTSIKVPAAELAAFVNGGAYTKGATGTGRLVLRIAELNSGPGSSTVYNDIKVPDDKTARAGDILMSWSGSLGVYRWFRDEAIINQHIFKVLPSGYPNWLVFDRLEAVMPIFRGVAADKATTMGHIQRGHLDSTLVELPSAESIRRLDETLASLWERLLHAEREVLDLIALRDALLPDLLSGRIRVPVKENAA
jgi:type I restriction enzyme S subunit